MQELPSTCHCPANNTEVLPANCLAGLVGSIRYPIVPSAGHTWPHTTRGSSCVTAPLQVSAMDHALLNVLLDCYSCLINSFVCIWNAHSYRMLPRVFSWLFECKGHSCNQKRLHDLPVLSCFSPPAMHFLVMPSVGSISVRTVCHQLAESICPVPWWLFGPLAPMRMVGSALFIAAAKSASALAYCDEVAYPA